MRHGAAWAVEGIYRQACESIETGYRPEPTLHIREISAAPPDEKPYQHDIILESAVEKVIHDIPSALVKQVQNPGQFPEGLVAVGILPEKLLLQALQFHGPEISPAYHFQEFQIGGV